VSTVNLGALLFPQSFPDCCICTAAMPEGGPAEKGSCFRRMPC